MPELRVSHLLIFGVIAVIIVVPLLIFGGVIGGFWIFTKENMEKGIAGASGYTPAKTPGECMDHFRDAIQARKYKYAAYYCTKNYAELLKRGHDGGSQLGADIDQIEKFGKNGGILSDKTKIALYRLDAFPKNFKVGPPPEEKKDGKAYGSFEWDPIVLANPANQGVDENYVKQWDPVMLSNVLTPRSFFLQGKGVRPVVLVKEGEEWKIDVAVDEQWDRNVKIYDDKYKTYHSGLGAFITDMTRERYADKAIFETGILDKLKAASK